MTDERRVEFEDSPEGRICEKFFSILEEIKKNFYRTGAGPQFPDRADFRKILSLYIRLELKKTELDVTKRHGTYPQALQVQREIEAINWEIAKIESK